MSWLEYFKIDVPGEAKPFSFHGTARGSPGKIRIRTAMIAGDMISATPAVEVSREAGLWNIVLSPGTVFLREKERIHYGAGHVRINFALPRPLLEEAVSRLVAAVRPSVLPLSSCSNLAWKLSPSLSTASGGVSSQRAKSLWCLMAWLISSIVARQSPLYAELQRRGGKGVGVMAAPAATLELEGEEQT